MAGAPSSLKRNITVACFAAVLLPMVWLFAGATFEWQLGVAENHRKEGGTLDLSTLAENETMIVVVRSTGCFHFTHHEFQFNGGRLKSFRVIEKDADAPDSTAGRQVMAGVLNEPQLAGLNGYLKYLRSGEQLVGSTTRYTIRVGYYRDGRRIGTEGFTSYSGLWMLHDDSLPPDGLNELYRLGLDYDEAVNLQDFSNFLHEEDERIRGQGGESIFGER